MQRGCVLASPRSWKESSAEPDGGRRRALTRLMRQSHVRNHRIRRIASVQAAPSPRPRAPGVPRLRLVRHRAPRARWARLCARCGAARQPEVPHPDERLDGDDRSRPHALGDARCGHRGERPPAGRLRRRQGLDRLERHRRELPRAQGEPRRRGARLHVRDRRRDGHPSRRAPLRGRSRRGGSPRLQRGSRATSPSS